MKKWTAAVLPLLLLTLSVTHASSAASSTEVIDMHGAKTYVGSSSAWGKTWDSDNFEEVTDDDVNWDGDLKMVSGEVADIDCGGDLTIEDGTIDDIHCDGDLVVEDGTMDDIDCGGDAVIKDGDIKSIYADGDITIKGGYIRHDVESYGAITLDGTVKIGGDVEADEITISSGADVTITGTITAHDYINLDDCTLKVEAICGMGTGTTLTIDDYTDTLPTLKELGTIIVTEDTNATADEKIAADELQIQEDAQFSTSSSLELDTLTGPGTLYFHSGKLTVDDIEGKPLLIFSDHVSRGDTAFYSHNDSIEEDDVRLYDYGLESNKESGKYEYILTRKTSEGITLSHQSVSLDSGKSVTIKADVDPDFSRFAEGTEIIWELYGDTEGFSKSVSSSGLSCTISVPSRVQGMYKATLLCYLVDSRGDRLEDYKSDSCLLTTGYSDNSDWENDTINSSANGITLDTSTVSILTGDTYWVLARTDDSSAPHAMSYNSSVATIGAGKAVKDSSGNPAWIYPVTGVGKGQVTIDIGGAKMITNVSTGITIDTSSYTMAPGGTYIIGVRTKGVAANSIWVSSDSSCVTVQLAGQSGDMLLYRIQGQKTGTAKVTFSIVGGESVHTEVTVQNGVKAGGVSARLVALA
ncbi:MAG: Carbohydrate-binding domain-containing protein [Oscillospiraceae bacterium]